MKSMQMILACLIIVSIVLLTGCERLMNKVADTVNKVAAKDSTGAFLGKMDLSTIKDSVSTVDGVKLKYTGITIL